MTKLDTRRSRPHQGIATLGEILPELKALHESRLQKASTEPEADRAQQIADLEAAPLVALPKRKRTRSAAAVQELVEQVPGLVPASELPPPPQEIMAHPEREPVRTEQPLNESRTHAQRVTADLPRFLPVAEGFRNVDSYPIAGVKVNRSLDKNIVALQFAEDRPLSRATEYDVMSQLQGDGFIYKPHRKQWERYDPEQIGASLLDAKQKAFEIANLRTGRGR